MRALSIFKYKKLRGIYTANGANKVGIIFSGGKWARLQLCKRCAAQLVKSNPCIAVEFLRQRRRKYARSRVQLPMRTSPHRERGRKPPFQTRAQRSGSRLKRACQNDMRANAAIAQGNPPRAEDKLRVRITAARQKLPVALQGKLLLEIRPRFANGVRDPVRLPLGRLQKYHRPKRPDPKT